MQGAKYDSARSTTDIAKAIREDIKAAMKKPPGDPLALPRGLRVSVRLERFSMGCSINARITAFLGPLLNPARVVWQRLFPHKAMEHAQFTKEGARVLAVLDALMAAYNFNESDPQTDYFNVRFYGDASVHWRYAAARRDEVIASVGELLADLAVTVASGALAEAERTVASLNEGYDPRTEAAELKALLAGTTSEVA